MYCVESVYIHTKRIQGYTFLITPKHIHINKTNKKIK